MNECMIEQFHALKIGLSFLDDEIMDVTTEWRMSECPLSEENELCVSEWGREWGREWMSEWEWVKK